MLNYKTCEEMTLSLQQTRGVSDANRLTWKVQDFEETKNSGDDEVVVQQQQVHSKVDCTKIELGPLDIRTFLVTI